MVQSLLEEQQHLLALVAAQPQSRAAPNDPAAAAQVEASMRRGWANPPDIAWVNEHGRVVVAPGDLHLGDDVSGRRWFDAAARGRQLSDEPADAQTALRAVHPMRGAAQYTTGVLVSPISCETIAQRLSADAEPARAICAP